MYHALLRGKEEEEEEEEEASSFSLWSQQPAARIAKRQRQRQYERKLHVYATFVPSSTSTSYPGYIRVGTKLSMGICQAFGLTYTCSYAYTRICSTYT